jgi:hypothetical protein
MIDFDTYSSGIFNVYLSEEDQILAGRSIQKYSIYADAIVTAKAHIAILIDFLRKMILMDLRKIKFGTVIEQFKQLFDSPE